MHLKNGKKLCNERGITFFHETERYVNNLNIYNRSKNGTNLWDDLILFKEPKALIYSTLFILRMSSLLRSYGVIHFKISIMYLYKSIIASFYKIH